MALSLGRLWRAPAGVSAERGRSQGNIRRRGSVCRKTAVGGRGGSHGCHLVGHPLAHTQFHLEIYVCDPMRSPIFPPHSRAGCIQNRATWQLVRGRLCAHEVLFANLGPPSPHATVDTVVDEPALPSMPCAVTNDARGQVAGVPTCYTPLFMSLFCLIPMH